MRVVPIRWTELETAFERNAPDAVSYLDLTTGEVVALLGDAPDFEERRAQVAANPSNYARVEPASSREQYRWMERFVVSVADDALRERLLIAIDGKGAFRRFKDVLLGYPGDRERWFTHRAELLHYHMQVWLEQQGIQPQNPSPWGEVRPPIEPEAPLVRPVAGGAEGPGELLRRQARELLDGIPAIDLPAAIAFLEYLRDRGAQELLRRAAAARAPARVRVVPSTAATIEDDLDEEMDRLAATATGEPR